jgi:hypothetical protein
MGKTNWVRVFLGGVLAGIVLIVLEMIANRIYLGKVWAPVLENLNLQGSIGLLIVGLIMWIVLGILSVWLYSAIRPRYGAGVKTAVIAGVFIWVVRELFPDIEFGSWGLYPANLVVADGATTLVTCIVGTIIGAWIYKEHHSPD